MLPIIDKLFINLKLINSSPKAKSMTTNIIKEIELIDNDLKEIGTYMCEVKKNEYFFYNK